MEWCRHLFLLLLLLLLLLAARCVASAGARRRSAPDLCYKNPNVVLPEDYDAKFPPVGSDGTEPVVVKSQHEIVDVVDVDDEAGTISMSLISIRSWADERIQTNFSHYRYIILDPDFYWHCVWTPTFVFDHMEEQDVWDMSGRRGDSNHFYLFQDSTLSYTGYSKIKIGCGFDFELYPFDTQVCNVTELSSELTMDRLVVRGRFMHEAKKQREIQYKVTVRTGESVRGNKSYLGIDTFATHSCQIMLKRRLNAHIMEIYLPTSLFLVASWISFLIPPEVVPGRMTLLVTLLLVQINLSLRVSDKAPTVSKVSAVLLWNIICIMQIMAAVIQYGILLYFSRKVSGNKLMRKSNKKKNKVLHKDHKTASCSNDHDDKLQRNMLKADRASFVAFPLVSICLGAVYWTHYLSLYYDDDGNDA